jgi:NADH-quinone oxidoreductase subunit J
MDMFLFLLFAAVAIGCAVNLVLQKHPISSAISLIGVMVSIAVLYLLLGAEFIAAAQVIVYGGAIMVLFVFVIMLLNTGAEEEGSSNRLSRYLGIPLLFVMVGLVSYVMIQVAPSAQYVTFGSFTGGGAADLGMLLFTKYLLPFETTSVLILIAILGAVVLAMREVD